MLMPLCFPEKTTSGPDDMGAEPGGMGGAEMKGVDILGGIKPKGYTYTHKSMTGQ